MLTDLDEERCMNDFAVAQNIERLKLRIKYLEKDNKDLQMDLEDVEATLQINKNIINTLVDTRSDLSNDSKKIISKMQKEIEVYKKHLQRIEVDRDRTKAELIVSEQVAKNVKTKEEEICSTYDIEIARISEQVEKKEYTLQLLEQRLYDCEKFLRKWGREDPFIREQLKFLKINPDLKKKKITNVVEENKMLKDQLKESLDEIETLHKKIMAMSKSPDDTTFLKESIIHNKSRIDMFMANEMFGDDIEPIGEESKEDEITNIATQASTKRDKGQTYVLTTKDTKRKLKIKNNKIESELEPFEGRTYHQIAVDINKIKSIKEAYPEEYKKKMEMAQEMLQKSLKKLQKELNETKQENVYLKDQVEIYKNNYEKVKKALNKFQKNQSASQELEAEGEDIFVTPKSKAEGMKQEIEATFSNIRSQQRRSHLIETFKKVDTTIEKFSKNKAPNMFNELSSIVVDPDDLPKDFKAFVTDTLDSKANCEIKISSAFSKKNSAHKGLNMKASKLNEYQENSRKDHL